MANPLSSRVESATRPAVIELLLALFLCLAFLVFMLLQLVYRSTYRHSKLARVRRNVRFEGDRILLSKSKDDPRRQLVEICSHSHEAAKRVAAKPPQYGRQIQFGVLGDGARRACLQILGRLQGDGGAVQTPTNGHHFTQSTVGSCASSLLDAAYPSSTAVAVSGASAAVSSEAQVTMRAAIARIRQSGVPLEGVDAFLWVFEAVLFGDECIVETITEADVRWMVHYFESSVMPALRLL